MDPQHRESQSTQETRNTPAGESEFPRPDELVANSEEIDSVYASMMLPPEGSGRIVTSHDAPTEAALGASCSSFESLHPLGEPLHATPNSFVDDHTSLTADPHDDYPWMDDIFLQSRSSHPAVASHELYDDHLSSAPPSMDDFIDWRQAASTPPLPSNSLRGSRGLPRRRSRYLIQHTDQSPNAVSIPTPTGPADPLERWKESPPEGEAASLSAIKNALQTSSLDSEVDQRPATPGSGALDAFQRHRCPASRAASTASGESATSASSRRSNQSSRSAVSNSSQTAAEKKSTGVRKKRASATLGKRNSANNPRIFCCTFCCDKFKSKYDWMRHENSLHLNLESWACAPFGGRVVLPSTGRAHCAYCSQLDPTPEHLQQHDHGACPHQEKYTFRRKDHLIQHLRLFHHLETSPLIDDWKRTITDFTSRCGFCNGRMSTWNERADHLTAHFRKGLTMADWKGGHEFPPDIAAQVTHSVPPWLLDFESRSFVPFSATNRAAHDHLTQMLSRAGFDDEPSNTQLLPDPPEAELHPIQEPRPVEEPILDSYTEVLTRHLSHYAQKMMGSGIIPTDEMFQSQARRLLFDSEDPWNQTMADNHEWLAQFREEQASPVCLQTPEEVPRQG